MFYPEGGYPGSLIAQRKAGINNIRVQLIPIRPAPHVMILGAADIAKLVSEMEDYDREWAKIVHLDTKNRLMGTETISIGSLSATIVHPRETVKGAILNNSSSVIFVHNHPSGVCEPSQEDQAMHDTLTRAFEFIGINLLDSVIVGKGCYYSLEERRLAKYPVQVSLVAEPGIEEDFEELEEQSRKRLAENLELSRKKTALEAEIKQINIELAAVKASCPAVSAIPAAPAAPPYQEVRKQVEIPPGPPAYKYSRPDTRTAVFMGTGFVRDMELERTVENNRLLEYPAEWYLFPPEEKRRRYGADIPTAFKSGVDQRRYSWEDLTVVYGIPAEYVQAWKKVAS